MSQVSGVRQTRKNMQHVINMVEKLDTLSAKARSKNNEYYMTILLARVPALCDLPATELLERAGPPPGSDPDGNRTYQSCPAAWPVNGVVVNNGFWLEPSADNTTLLDTLAKSLPPGENEPSLNLLCFALMVLFDKLKITARLYGPEAGHRDAALGKVTDWQHWPAKMAAIEDFLLDPAKAPDRKSVV